MQSEYPSASEAETGNARTATGGSAESELQDNEQSCVQVDTGLHHSKEDQEEAEAIEAFFEKGLIGKNGTSNFTVVPCSLAFP